MSYLAGPEVILACIRGVLEGREYYKKTRRLRELTEELDGPAAVRKFLEDRLKEGLMKRTPKAENKKI